MAVDVGRALMGLGAAVGGEAPQFRQQMMQEDELARKRGLEDEQAAEKRKQTLFADASAASNLLDQGDVGGVLGLMQDRFQILSQIPNVDTSHTKRYLQLAQAAAAGDMEAKDRLTTEMNNAVTAGRAYNQISTDSNLPASYKALRLRARDSGLEEGTEGFKEFMRTSGGSDMQTGTPATKVFKNGSVLRVTRGGQQELTDKFGRVITDPQRRAEALDDANKSGVIYETDIAMARERGGAQEGRAQTAINDGIDAAQRMPQLMEARKILENVGTGGMKGAMLAFKQRLGITSADESKLIYELQKSVLSQLKPTFGAAFTYQEGALLGRIEANTDMSTEGNMRLLDDLIDKLDLAVQRGRVEARANQDTRSLSAIDGYLARQFEAAGGDLEGVDPAGARPEGGGGEPTPQPATPRRFKFNPETGELEENN
jgi:hypothetical protein